jgi:predicted DsbA family dithiol-disulfide isomerase
LSKRKPEPLTIDYYTDILCVWAWIAQRRVEELDAQWGEQIRLVQHCVSVFADTAGKMNTQWRERGGFDAFADHVQAAAADYESAPVHPDLWRRVRPTTSANAHLLLKATELSHSPHDAAKLAAAIRHAFFVEARDVSQLPELMTIAGDSDLDADALKSVLDDGSAMAALFSDYAECETLGVKGSPSWVMNNGRQVLYGNLGYRILHANVEELLRHPDQDASWC